MSTTESGRAAEQAVAEFLKKSGYSIRDQNWRTRWCEIDVVAEKDHTIYFVEVKYRKTALQGDGLEYITSKKLQQMTFAAELWVNAHRWQHEYCLAAAAVSGLRYDVDRFIEL